MATAIPEPGRVEGGGPDWPLIVDELIDQALAQTDPLQRADLLAQAAEMLPPRLAPKPANGEG